MLCGNGSCIALLEGDPLEADLLGKFPGIAGFSKSGPAWGQGPVVRRWKDMSLPFSNSRVKVLVRLSCMRCRKDVFRLAFLKLNASMWLSPVRPGVIGAFLLNGFFLPRGMIQPLAR